MSSSSCSSNTTYKKLVCSETELSNMLSLPNVRSKEKFFEHIWFGLVTLGTYKLLCSLVLLVGSLELCIHLHSFCLASLFWITKLQKPELENCIRYSCILPTAISRESDSGSVRKNGNINEQNPVE